MRRLSPRWGPTSSLAHLGWDNMVYALIGDDPDGRLTREMIATALREVADDVCRDHVMTITQEPQITSRIGEALERRLAGSNINGYRVEVLTQDLPDRGSRSLERPVGADIYLGIRVMLGGHVDTSKGMLAQAKKWPNLSAEEGGGLTEQCKRMLARSPASYVWIYTVDGVGVVSAEDVIRRELRKLSYRRRLDEVLSEILACNEGDTALGLPPGRDTRRLVGMMLEELRGVRTGIAVSISSDD